MTTLAASVGPRDDRILGGTRLVAAAIVPFLVVAFIILYLFPNDTERLFAWTIKPPMTPMLMGAGYIAGAYFFVRAIAGRRWHEVTAGFLPVTAFASSMAVATLLHWDRFNHQHPAFYVWVALYALTPFLVLATWLRNRSTDPGTADPDDAIVPGSVRVAEGLIGALIVAIGFALFLRPDLMLGIWPWKLTPLTARVVGGWFALPGVSGLVLSAHARWNAGRIPVQSQTLGIALILVAVIRDWGDFNPQAPMTWIFVGGMLALLAFLVVLYLSLEARRSGAAAARA